MLTFFRRIRKGLLDDSRTDESSTSRGLSASTSKPASLREESSQTHTRVSGPAGRYLLYAIGEIALVVIGILIALQINNWNEYQKERKEERQLLNGLAGEFEENLDRIASSMDANLEIKAIAIALVEMVRSGQILNRPPELDSLIVGLTLFSTFDAATGVVDEIINSGKLAVIADQDLRTKLTHWSSLLEEVKEDRLIRLNMYTDQLVPTLMKFFSLANGQNYLDFSTWSGRYKAERSARSPFKARLTAADLPELENVIWQHKYNNDFILMNELELEAYILETLELIHAKMDSQ